MSIIELSKENFDEVVKKNEIVVFDFWAEWCGPCKTFAKTFTEVAEKNKDVVFAKVNIEQEKELATDFQVRSIPHVMIIRDNVAVFSESGAMPASALTKLIEQAKNLDMQEVLKDIQAQADQQE